MGGLSGYSHRGCVDAKHVGGNGDADSFDLLQKFSVQARTS